MKTKPFDLFILGGGPAGASAAIHAARAGLTVALAERSNYEGLRIGETLPPEARPLLTRLKAWVAFRRANHEECLGVDSAWGSSELIENHHIFNPHGSGWRLDRQTFDATLACEAGKAGAKVFRGYYLDHLIKQPGKSWRLSLANGRRRGHLRAKFLLDASGRSSVVIRRLGHRRIRADRMVGVAAMCHVPDSDDLRASIVIEAAQEGWWYTLRLPRSRRVVCYMTDSDILPEGKQLLSIFWRRALNTTLHIRKLLPDSSIEFNLKVWPAGSDRSSGVAGEQWMAIGDAALAFDPLSSQGILHALISAERAVDCIARSNANRFDTEPYVTWTGRVLADYEKHRRWYYGLETRWPESVFWQRRQSGLLASSASAVSMVK